MQKPFHVNLEKKSKKPKISCRKATGGTALVPRMMVDHRCSYDVGITDKLSERGASSPQ